MEIAFHPSSSSVIHFSSPIPGVSFPFPHVQHLVSLNFFGEAARGARGQGPVQGFPLLLFLVHALYWFSSALMGCPQAAAPWEYEDRERKFPALTWVYHGPQHLWGHPCSGMKHHTSNVFLVLSPATSPLIHPLCCFLFVSYISSSVCLRRSTMYPCWNSGLQWVVSLSLRAVWDWLWLAQGNSWPPLALVTPRALWHQNPAVYTQYTSKCALANNLNGSLWTAVVVFSYYSKFSSLV